jgi:cystathionine beta-lyase/cystathionine gamma-synthase
VNYESKFAPGAMIYFVLKEGTAEAAEKVIDYIADHSYCITLAVSLGQIRTLVESPYTMTHSALPDSEKRHHGMEPAGIRLSVGLEDRHDLIEDLAEALECLPENVPEAEMKETAVY